MTELPQADPDLDLVLDRTIEVPRDLVWKAWTTPEHMKHWYCPKPWTVSKCEIDLQPGGQFHTTLRSPEGQEFPYTGCYLEIKPPERLVWTMALLPGYRPAPPHEFATFTVFLTLRALENGTHYNATVLHLDEPSRQKHLDMGFREGWNTVLDQLIDYAQTME